MVRASGLTSQAVKVTSYPSRRRSNKFMSFESSKYSFNASEMDLMRRELDSTDENR